MSKKRYGGGGKQYMAGLMGEVIGGAFLLFALILFGIGLGQLDTAYTNAATYTEQVGLTDIMGIFGMVLFLVFAGAGIACIAGGAVLQFVRTIKGGWMDSFMSFAMGSVGLVIALILNTLIQSQLADVYDVAANVSQTVNTASFVGMTDIMTIFGMIIFLALVGSGISGVVGAGIGAVKNIKSGF